VLVDEGVAGDGRWVGSTWRCWSTRVLLVMGGGWGRHGEVLVDEGVAGDGRWVRLT
jgi:hypothetical protein